MTTSTTPWALWSSVVGDELTLETAEGRRVPLRLVACTLTDPDSGSFTLVFRAGDDAPGQGTHLLRGEGIPDSPVFLVPTASDADGVELHAVFNLRALPGSAEDGAAP